MIEAVDKRRFKPRIGTVGGEQAGADLNAYTLYTDGLPEALRDYGAETPGIRVHFRDLERTLCRYISRSQLVVGAVAWLTSAAILRALSGCEHVAIVVQKEDFLRPEDCGDRARWAATLRRRYEALSGFPMRYAFPFLGGFSVACDPPVDPVRCVGNHNRAQSPAHPRMHHKFLVFCRWETPDEEEQRQGAFGGVVPTAVWTGSFNLTETAGRSLENALYIDKGRIVQAYFDEWQQIMGLSEALEWESEWCAPEWRLGT